MSVCGRKAKDHDLSLHAGLCGPWQNKVQVLPLGVSRALHQNRESRCRPSLNTWKSRRSKIHIHPLPFAILNMA